MIRVRHDVRSIAPYRPGRPIPEVAREFGFDPDEIVKLASNESPLPPVRQAIAAMSEEVGKVNRYISMCRLIICGSGVGRRSC